MAHGNDLPGVPFQEIILDISKEKDIKDKFRLGMFYGYILGSSITFLYCYLLYLL